MPLEIWLKFRLVREINWYSHQTESAFENDQVKILWDFNVQTDYVIENRRPNITILDKTEVKYHLADIVVLGDKKYQNRNR